ncbi:MAG: hypothetical protein V3U75_04085 [Methylococcaceae bacterium]
MKSVLTILAILFMVSGCSFFREQAKTGCEELTLNTTAARELSVCILESHLFWSGFARKALLGDIDKLDVEAMKAWDGLDALALKYQEQGELTDMEWGDVLGFKVRVLREAVYEILERVAPEALRYIPR